MHMKARTEQARASRRVVAPSFYEVVGDRAEPRFDVQGWSYQFFKVR
jgi:hypothetical protein